MQVDDAVLIASTKHLKDLLDTEEEYEPRQGNHHDLEAVAELIIVRETRIHNELQRVYGVSPERAGFLCTRDAIMMGFWLGHRAKSENLTPIRCDGCSDSD